MPLLTTNLIDVAVQHRPIARLWRNALILVLLLLQNIPLHVLHMRELSTAIHVPAFLPFFLVMVPVSATLIQTMRRKLSNRNQQFREETDR